MVLRIAFAGEGTTEYGRGPSRLAFDKEQYDEDGFLQVILKKALVERFGEEKPFETGSRIQWKNIRLHAGGKRERHCVAGAKLAAAVGLAQLDESDGLVFIVDDGQADFTDELMKDLAQLRSECDDVAISAGTAIRMIEAALLADGEAVAAEFPGLKLSRTKAPEKVANPKAVFKKDYLEYQVKTKERFVKETSWTQARKKIIARLSLETLRERCPKGLGRFIGEMDAVLKLFEE